MGGFPQEVPPSCWEEEFCWEDSLVSSVSGDVGRRLRYLPYPETLVEITNRTIQARMLLAPSKRLNRIVLGAIGRAQRRYGVEIHAFVFLSNHYHMLVTVRDVQQMSRFVGYFEAKIAKEVARLAHWRDKIWGRRYTPIPVSNEEADQVGRLEYLLSQGVKEGFVPHPGDWPGAQSVAALLDDAPIKGIWHDRTAEYRAKLRGENRKTGGHSVTEVIELSPLPCWRDQSAERTRELARELVEQVTETARKAAKGSSGRAPKVNPTDRPWRSKRSPAPWFHCTSKAMRLELRAAYREFLAAYRLAAEKLRCGELTAPFPDGSFPPPRPFIAAAA